EVLPLDTFRTEFMGHQWGVPAEMLCYNRPYTYRQAMSFALLHDVLVRGRIGAGLEMESKLWHEMDAFGRRQARFIPYWETDLPVRTGEAALKVTTYSRGRKGAMLIISNLGGEPVDARVEIDRSKLGLPAGAKLGARDILGETTIGIEGDVLSFALDPLDFRALHITPER
ncbi:MAG TPA: DUF6067 family protein, partial [Armatimonadota bacterium]|nr:DUF6067 family protein [Armatimonadota bacterium]